MYVKFLQNLDNKPNHSNFRRWMKLYRNNNRILYVKNCKISIFKWCVYKRNSALLRNITMKMYHTWNYEQL